MQAEFWLQRWNDKQIGFHRASVNPLLTDHVHHLELKAGARLFLPLCGKTLDIGWLLAHGYSVIGVELSQIAVEELFDELGVAPGISDANGLTLYQAPGVDIFLGDYFALTSMQLGDIDAVYDRASLIALPETMRAAYAKKLMEIASGKKQLLITLEYDQSVVSGPPFSVDDDEVSRHYAARYSLTKLADDFDEKGLKGEWPVNEKVWLLEPNVGE